MLAALAVAAAAMAATTATPAEPPPAEAVVIRGAIQSEPVTPLVADVDLRDLPKIRGWQPGEAEREVPRRHTAPAPDSDLEAIEPAPREPMLDPLLDPLLEGQGSAAPQGQARGFETPDLNFEGIPYTGATPPDTVGDVGPDHYIQMVNDGFGGSAFAIYDKSGAVLVGPTGLDTLWSGGGPCRFGLGDPIVLHDGLADRWLMSEFSSSGSRLCVYISRTPDPVSGGWFLYAFNVPRFPDYPKYAVWPDAYYVSSNESGPAVYALDRNRMLNGLPATFQRFAAPRLSGFPFQALIPSDLDGATPPPAGSPNYFMRHRDDEVHNPLGSNPSLDFLEIWEFRVDFATPANSTFSGPTNIAVAEFDSDLCGLSSFSCFPQPGTATRLDPLREVVMWRLQYRNFGGREVLVGNLVTDVDGTDHGGIRWFELEKSGAGAWALAQEGTHAPDQDNRWMGSVAMNGDGDMALGYSVSSASQFPSIRYAGRLAGDPAGLLPQGEFSVLEGSFSQSGSTRWGDYSAMSVDPADDCTFWYTTEYVATPSGNWGTRIATFRFPSCGVAEAIGGSVTGLDLGIAVCRNLTTGQTVEVALQPGAVSWDCEAAGLSVDPGQVVLTVSAGLAESGPEPAGGSVTAIDLRKAFCVNRTTSQAVEVPLSAAQTSWDCEAAGLSVDPGQVIMQIAAGLG